VTPGREQDDSGHGRHQPLAVVERSVDLLGLPAFLALLLAPDGPLNALGPVEAGQRLGDWAGSQVARHDPAGDALLVVVVAPAAPLFPSHGVVLQPFAIPACSGSYQSYVTLPVLRGESRQQAESRQI